jgi:hypothetical protein
MAAFATTVPVYEFNVDTFGIGLPVGHVVNRPMGPGGTIVKFNEYAAAVAGIPHELEGKGKERCVPAVIDGGPNAPVNPAAARVSATRHGVTG